MQITEKEIKNVHAEPRAVNPFVKPEFTKRRAIFPDAKTNQSDDTLDQESRRF
jgi:hypothetical protein